MRKVIRIFSLMLVVVMTLSLMACGNSQKEATNNTETTKETTTASAESSKPGESGEPAEQKKSLMPDIELKNKVIKVFNIVDNLNDWRSTTQYPGVIELLEQEYGVTFEMVPFSDYGQADEKLMALYMSNDMPDLNLFPTFPSGIANDFMMPLNDLVDISSPLWDVVREEMEMLKWNGKYYYGVRYPLITTEWFFYNPQIFEANNVKTPMEYYEEGNWTWDTVLELAKQLTFDYDGDGQMDQWGLGWASSAGMVVHTQTGVPLVEITADGKFKHNMRDPKLAEAANFFRSLGPAENNVMHYYDFAVGISQDTVAQEFAAGKIAMLLAGWWRITTPDFAGKFENGTLDMVKMPKWRGEATNYRSGQFQLIGVCSKAKNPEGAALFIQMDLFTQTKEYTEKYMPGVDTNENEYFRSLGMNDQQLKTAMDLMYNFEDPAIPMMHWSIWSWEDGFMPVLTKPWSQVLEEVVPHAESKMNEWMEKLAQIK